MQPNHLLTIVGEAQAELEELEGRYRAAWTEARPPSRRGEGQMRRSEGTHSDPTEHAALHLIDLLDRIAESVKVVRSDVRMLNRHLDEWGPERSFPQANQRCSLPGCASKHHAKGLCVKHYRREQRAEERRDERAAS